MNEHAAHDHPKADAAHACCHREPGTQAETHSHHAAHDGHGDTPLRIAAHATLHCLTGCVIGEIAGLLIGVGLGLAAWQTVVLATTLSYASGFSLGLWPLVKRGMGVAGAFRTIWLGEVVSIGVMEIAMNVVDLPFRRHGREIGVRTAVLDELRAGRARGFRRRMAGELVAAAQQDQGALPLNMPFDPARRRFVTSAFALAGATALPRGLFAQNAQAHVVPELRGRDFVLDIGALPVDLSGRRAWAKTVNGSLPAPTLRWREGDTVSLRVNNSLHETTSLHWHGIVLPADMDGVPGLSFHGIAPSASYLYRFPVRQAGTYWYHAHSSLQEAQGVYGAIVIDPARTRRRRCRPRTRRAAVGLERRRPARDPAQAADRIRSLQPPSPNRRRPAARCEARRLACDPAPIARCGAACA